MKKFALFLLAGMSAFASVHAQQVLNDAAADAQCAGSRRLVFSSGSSVPSFIVFRSNYVLKQEELNSRLASILQTGNDVSWQRTRSETDALGFTHERYQQLYKQLRVEGGEYIVHVKTGLVQSMNGHWFDHVSVNTTLRVSRQQALEKALHFTGARLYKWEIAGEEAQLKENTGDPSASYYPQGELLIAEANGGTDSKSLRLAWKFDVYAAAPLSRNFIYVDAQTGAILRSENELHEIDKPATANTRYSGVQTIVCDSVSPAQYRLRESGRGLGIRTFNIHDTTDHVLATDFYNATNSWTNTVNDDDAANDAHWAAEKVYDYFSSEHSRNSINGSGMALVSYVHYSTHFDGAFWDGGSVNLGDGSQQPGGSNPMVSMDIIGHEFTHGLTQFVAGLANHFEQGALNESFSDIFGTAMEFYAKPSTANFKIGDEVAFSQGAYLRDMQDPNVLGHPKTYQGNYWYTGTGDNGGIHINCGVQNYWFYLLCQGGSGVNELGENYSVNAIGMQNAAKIAYRTLVNYLVMNSDYSDAHLASLQAAGDIFGPCSPELIAVTNAWHAVGIGEAFDGWPTASFSSELLYTGQVLLTMGFTNSSSDYTSADWNFGDNGIDSVISPVHNFGTNGTYTVTLVVTNSLGCMDTAMQEVHADGIFIPNVFTPNDDHVNDYFYISASGFVQYRIEIFDRWGDPVFSSDGPEVQWSGRHRNGNLCDPGTYFYLLKAVTPYSDYSTHGTITIPESSQ